MKTYEVTRTYFKSIQVEAESEKEALEIAEDLLDQEHIQPDETVAKEV